MNPRSALLSLLVTLLALDLLFRGFLPALGNSGGDFANFYTAARVVAEGKPLDSAYRDFTWFQKRIDECGFEGQLGGFVPHPPSTALVFLPLEKLDPSTAKMVWTFLNAILAILCVFLLSRVSGLPTMAAALVLLLTGAGLRNDFLFGQLYLLLLASILGGLYCHQRGRPILSGILLGVLGPIKYASLPWGLYFCWKRRWWTVLAMAATVLAVLLATVWLVGWSPFQVFLDNVLPRHLAGEIQDPFATRLQTWASLFRRLFVAEAALNPSPPLDFPPFFFLFKNLVFWLLTGISLLVMVRVRLPDTQQTELFHWGWITLAMMLLSPGAATYHYLLLTMPTAFFSSILWSRNLKGRVYALVICFGVLNLPHYLWLESLAQGWTTPLAYSRLGLLLLFFCLTISFFRDWIDFSSPNPLWLAVPLAAAALLFWHDWHGYRDPRVDGARWLEAVQEDPKGRIGLIQTDPDIGARGLVFCSMVRHPDGYAVYETGGRAWITEPGRNFYHPDLAADGFRLLVEGIEEGEQKIWLSAARGSPPQAIVKGVHPSWSPSGASFVFERDGRIHLWDLAKASERPLPIEGGATDPVFLPDRNLIAYCVKEVSGYSLRLFDLDAGAETMLLSSPDRVSEPGGLPSGKGVLFAWDRDGNRDIWAILIPSRDLIRLTSHPAADGEPIWDARSRRVLFTSDRGRGVGYRSVYWITAPAELTE